MTATPITFAPLLPNERQTFIESLSWVTAHAAVARQAGFTAQEVLQGFANMVDATYDAPLDELITLGMRPAPEQAPLAVYDGLCEMTADVINKQRG
jgi:hypothetical protein